MGGLRFVNVVLGGLLVGGLALEHVVVLPTLRRLSGDATIHALRIMGPIAWRYLPVCGVGSTLAAVGAVLLEPRFEEAAVRLTVAGVVVSLLAVAANLGLYLPIERRMRRWSPDAVPAELPTALRRAGRIHLLRMTLFGIGFCLYVAAAVIA